jgi:endonuclease G, mitochondrial
MPEDGTTITIEIPIEIRIGRPRVDTSIPGASEGTSIRINAQTVRPSRTDAPDAAFEIDDDYAGRKGYDEDWLGVRIPLPLLSEEQMREVSPDTTRDDDDRHVLRYYNFSVVMNGKHRLMFFGACNATRDPGLQGKLSRSSLSEGKGDKWILDPRIPAAHQITTRELYSKIHFDRGHIVRRDDVYWGRTERDAAFANFDSFHYTNCTPQAKSFNRSTLGDGLWGKLENHIADSAETDGEKLSYFAGPIFRSGRMLSGAFVPFEFFKVVVAPRKVGKLGAWAFRLSQLKQVEGAPEPIFAPDEFETYLVSIAKLERLTGLTFPKILHEIDARKGSGEDQLFASLSEIPLSERP